MTVYKTNFRTPALEILKNLMRSLTAWFEDGYCSITVANHPLIIVIRFVAKNYIRPWRDFANRFHLVLHAESRIRYSSTTGNSMFAYVSLFAVCFLSGTRQRATLPYATTKTPGLKKTHGKSILCRVLFLAHGKSILCRVTFLWHMANPYFAVCLFFCTRQKSNFFSFYLKTFSTPYI